MSSAWWVAVRAGDAETLGQQISSGAAIDAEDEHGQTALMIAARDGRVPVARLLISRGAALDHTAKFNLTALMLAVINRRVEIVRALVEAGADLTVRGSGAPGFNEKSALDLAVAQAYDATVAPQLAEIALVIAAAIDDE